MSERPPMNIYAGAEFLTAGAADTIELISRSFGLHERSRVLEVAYGTGAGAWRLAERHRCNVLGIDLHPLAKYTARRAIARGVADRVAFAMGDGGCAGARCGIRRSDLHRRAEHRRHGAMPGGDAAGAAAGRHAGGQRLGVARGGGPGGGGCARGIDPRLLTLDGYAELIREAGFEIVSAEPLPQSAWDDYYARIRKNLAAMRAADSDMPHSQIDDELRIWDSGLGPEWWRYGVFVARAA
jgi:hypothetical protein